MFSISLASNWGTSIKNALIRHWCAGGSRPTRRRIKCGVVFDNIVLKMQRSSCSSLFFGSDPMLLIPNSRLVFSRSFSAATLLDRMSKCQVIRRKLVDHRLWRTANTRINPDRPGRKFVGFEWKGDSPRERRRYLTRQRITAASQMASDNSDTTIEEPRRCVL